MGMIQQSYNEIDGINFRADAKRCTHKTKKKDNIMSIVRRCKKQHHVIFHSVNSANVGNQQSVMHDVVHDKKIVCDNVHNQ